MIDAFDLADPQVQAEPFAHYARLRERHPVYRRDRDGGATFVLSRYDDIVRVLRNPLAFSSRTLPINNLLFKDPPEHTRLRNAIGRSFTTRAIDAFRPGLEKQVGELYQRYLDVGGGDFVAEVASLVPSGVIAELLGVPASQMHELRRWSGESLRAINALGDGEEDRRLRASALELRTYLAKIVTSYQSLPAENITSTLVNQRGPDALSVDDVVDFCQILFVAAHETVAGMLGSGMELLARRPELLETLRAQPETVADFVEEVLRCFSPVQRLYRVTLAPARIRDVDVPRGALLVLLIGSGNRDSERFPDGDRFDLARRPTGTLAFGFGSHACIGSTLARIEGRTVFRLVSERTRRVALVADAPPVRATGGTFSEYGNRVLPLSAEAL